MTKAAPKKRKRNLKKELVFLCSCCAVGILLFITGFNLNSFFNNQKVLGVKTVSDSELIVENETLFWENFLVQNPTYFDGWLKLAKISIEKGEKEKAIEYINKAKDIDPNSPLLYEILNSL